MFNLYELSTDSLVTDVIRKMADIVKMSNNEDVILNVATNSTLSAYGEPEWIETLNYTVDYGDKTCTENRNGNPWKENYVDLLNHWNLLSTKYNVSYFLVYGSLIGAVRNKNFIPYDGDMDIMVDKIDYEVIASIDNKRNFIASAHDMNFHLIVQNAFREQYLNSNKPRQNCLGEVKII